jgi:hypothetical protein
MNCLCPWLVWWRDPLTHIALWLVDCTVSVDHTLPKAPVSGQMRPHSLTCSSTREVTTWSLQDNTGIYFLLHQ